MRSRPLPVTAAAAAAAAVLLALLSVLSVVFSLFTIEGIPAAFVVVVSFVLGVVGLVAAYGLWALKRRSVMLTILVTLPNILSTAPGMFFAPTGRLRFLNIAGVAGFALIIVLVVLLPSRHAFVATRVPENANPPLGHGGGE